MQSRGPGFRTNENDGRNATSDELLTPTAQSESLIYGNTEPKILAQFIPCILIKIFIHNANERNDNLHRTENTSYRDRVH